MQLVSLLASVMHPTLSRPHHIVTAGVSQARSISTEVVLIAVFWCRRMLYHGFVTSKDPALFLSGGVAALYVRQFRKELREVVGHPQDLPYALYILGFCHLESLFYLGRVGSYSIRGEQMANVRDRCFFKVHLSFVQLDPFFLAP